MAEDSNRREEGVAAVRYDAIESLRAMGIRFDCERLLRRAGLTWREAEIATLVLRSLKPRDIATRLGIARHTVSVHIKRIYDKMRVHSRSALILKVIGLLAEKAERRRAL